MRGGRLCSALVDAVLPSGECESCGSDSSSGPVPGICRTCWKGRKWLEPPLCTLCGVPISRSDPAGGIPLCGDCESSPPPFVAHASAYLYAGPVRRLLLLYKDQRRYSLAPLLGQVIWRLVLKTWPGVVFNAAVPVPSPLSRVLTRGFSPAGLIAREASARLHVPHERLLKMRKTPQPQKGLTAAQRRVNVRAAFGVAGTVESGARLLLIDDITTTGATVREASKVLAGAGAEVYAATVAMAVKRDLDMASLEVGA